VAAGENSTITRCRKENQNCVGIISTRKEEKMADSVYKVIELVGSSETSWEEAAKNAVERAGQTLRDLRVAEVSKLDMKIENGKITAFRTRVNLSFKYGGGE
jgi:dodecin